MFVLTTKHIGHIHLLHISMLSRTSQLLGRHRCEEAFFHPKSEFIFSIVHGAGLLLLFKEVHPLLDSIASLGTRSGAIFIIVAVFRGRAAVIGRLLRRLLQFYITACVHALVRVPVLLLRRVISNIWLDRLAATVAHLLSLFFESTRIGALNTHLMIHHSCI